MTHPTRFDNLLELARLPWFESRKGRLVLADPALRGAIDVHTHLAFSYGPGRVDLGASTPETQHYLPARRALDLDKYANRNFAPEDLAAMKRDLTLGSISPVPFGMRTTHTVPNLCREMEELGIETAILLAIDFPVGSHNTDRWLEASRGVSALMCFGGLHALTPGLEAHLDALVAKGVRGVKVHPAVQLLPPDADAAMALYRSCGARGLLVTFHCGPVDIETALGRRFSQVKRYERAIAECPGTTFVLGHSGALQLDEGLALAQRYPNVWLELSSQGLPGVRRLLAEGPDGRVMFGSDWPFYHPAIPLAKLAMAAEGDTTMLAAVLHGNARRLLAQAPRPKGS